MIDQLRHWHNTKIGLGVFGATELLLAYPAVLWAIDSGNLFVYLLIIILLIGGLQNLVKLVLKALWP